MKKWEILVLFLLLVLAVTVFSLPWAFSKGSQSDPKRFQVLYNQHLESFSGAGSVYIIEDTETGRKYIISSAGNAGGICLLEEEKAEEKLEE